MAQQSARRGWDNQAVPPCFKHAHVIWTRSANSHTGRRLSSCRIKGRTDGSIRLRATTILTFSLAWEGASTDGTGGVPVSAASPARRGPTRSPWGVADASKAARAGGSCYPISSFVRGVARLVGASGGVVDHLARNA